ncbi:MAG: carbonic anhydrase [Acidobacteriaceae bacterium]|nr:carbonic anhydrase [Acidobacteriaceae bacterium]
MEQDNALNKLLEGVRRFRREVYPKNRERYEQAAMQPQRPHTLVITCADSRIDPELLTQSGPGDIFVTRNIGNLVPAYGMMLGGVSSVIEYAVVALEVSQIVVCGHTDCGAMKGLLHREKLTSMPTVNAWLQNAEAALSVVEARNAFANESQKLEELIEENVLLQLNHLRTHPSVAGRMAQGKLGVYGWVYDIGKGFVNMHEVATNKFVPIGEA